MIALALFALLIFVVFAVVGGAAVFFIIKKQQESGEGDLPPRGVPWSDEERLN